MQQIIQWQKCPLSNINVVVIGPGYCIDNILHIASSDRQLLFLIICSGINWFELEGHVVSGLQDLVERILHLLDIRYRGKRGIGIRDLDVARGRCCCRATRGQQGPRRATERSYSENGFPSLSQETPAGYWLGHGSNPFPKWVCNRCYCTAFRITLQKRYILLSKEPF